MANWRDNWAWGCVTFLWAMITVPVWVISILLAALVMGPYRSFWTIAPWFARQLFAVVGIHWEVQGWERLPEEIRSQKQPVIFMSNHESQLDPPFLLTAIPIPAVYIAKKELRFAPFVGWAAMCAGVIFINRGNREKAFRSIHEAALKIRGGRNVVIFPEGTRSRSGQLLPFKKGGFQLAQEAGVPVVPIATVGGHGILAPGARRMRPLPYKVIFGDPVDPAAFADREALMVEVRARIEALIGAAALPAV